MPGKLYFVGISIGHQDDITYRAVKTLSAVDVIAAEDTRKAKKLLSDLSIKSPQLVAHGAHNEHHSAAGIVSLLLAGKDVAYISDAGMPGVSDPGYLLQRAALDIGCETVVIPGVTAAVTALAASGLPSDQFTFIGFLPRKDKARKEALDTLLHRPETLVFYESPHRVVEMIRALANVFPSRGCMVGRELTKTHEELLRGTVESCAENLSTRKEILGEFTIVVEGDALKGQVDDLSLLEESAINLLSQGLSVKEIRDALATRYTGAKKDLYRYIQSLK